MNVLSINMNVICMLYALIISALTIVPVSMDSRAMVVTAKVLYKAGTTKEGNISLSS